MFLAIALAVAVLAGSTASVVGFGIGSLLTPLLATELGTELAIAAVALPHLAGSVLRGWRLRGAVDRSVLVRFGILSAGGGLLGALAFSRLAAEPLTRILGLLLLLTATAGITRWSERWSPKGLLVWLLGAFSGFFGGVVGNQGGLRAAALSAFHLSPIGFVATSTIIGVAIDVVRTPVYLQRHGVQLVHQWGLVAICIVGVLVGTLLGERLLFGLSRERFRVVVSLAIGVLGVWFLVGAGV
jgi:uncharacterized membrane protein YfcA